MMRVCQAPFYKGDDKADGGIRRVVEAMVRYLPEHGWHVTDNPDEADLIACHGATLMERPGIPMVAHCHGLLWEDYFAHYADDVNRKVIDVMVRAQAVTAPSHWVAHAISRGMLVAPEIIYHGVDADVWQPTEAPLDYVLWNKARTDPVSDPADMQAVADLLPDVRFLSTYAQKTANVLPIGVGTYEQMRPVVQRAAVYLATTRETFGIGTLEALAAGVPIAGWNYGGQAEIVVDGQTGYLAPFGDVAALADAVRRCLEERERLSPNCITDARERWGWKDKIERYAALYTRTVEAWREKRPKVSVIVTAYNLEHFLGEALTSVAEQTMRDWECLIVDDCSTDDTAKLAKLWTEDYKTPAYDGRSFTSVADTRFRYVKTPENLGLAGARNYGWQHAKGKYVLFLDADDLLDRNALDTLANALDHDLGIHIAYGSLDTMAYDGTQRKRNPWPAGEFNWHAQVAHLNQLHGASLMRREVLERSGGYRTRDWRAEDASFWARVTSFGFRAARVTDETIQIYRMHDAQKSRGEPGDGDWAAWLPWRIAGSAHDGLKAMQNGTQPNAQIVPFGAQGTPPPPRKAWPVRHYQHPVVSVIIPVGPGHAEYLVDALDSVQAQTMVEWEAIVVNDTGQPRLDGITHIPPWARVVSTGLEGKLGAGAARNIGTTFARAPFVVFLDADDVLHPRFLEETLRAYDGRYVYTDWATLENPNRIDGEVETHTVEEYDAQKMLGGLRHAITALVPTDWVRAVGGFDEGLACFEDWDLYCKLAVGGGCGKRLDKPLLIYRYQHGQRTRTALRAREEGQTVPRYTELGEQVAAAVSDRFAAYRSGEEPVMGCGSCGGGDTVETAAAALNDMVSFMTAGAAPAVVNEGATVRMEFIGDQFGAMTYYGAKTGTRYLAGREPGARYLDVFAADVEHLVNTGKFRVVDAAPLVASAVVEDTPKVAVEPRITERPKPKGRKVT